MMKTSVNKGLWPCACGQIAPTRTHTPAGAGDVAVLECRVSYNKATGFATLQQANSGRHRASTNNLTNHEV